MARHTFEFQPSLVSCPIAEMKHSNEINLNKRRFILAQGARSLMQLATEHPLSRSREQMYECAAARFHISIHTIQDPSQGAVPPTRGGSSHRNDCNQDTPTGMSRDPGNSRFYQVDN